METMITTLMIGIEMPKSMDGFAEMISIAPGSIGIWDVMIDLSRLLR